MRRLSYKIVLVFGTNGFYKQQIKYFLNYSYLAYNVKVFIKVCILILWRAESFIIGDCQYSFIIVFLYVLLGILNFMIL